MEPSGKRLSPQTVMREIYLSRIIGGLIFDDETARELCRKIDVTLPWDGFVSCVIAFDEHCSALRGGERSLVNALLDEIYSSAPSFFAPEYRAYIAFNDRYLNCLVNLPGPLDPTGGPGGDVAPDVRNAGDILRRLAEHIYAKTGVRLLAALGNAVSGFGQIGVSTGQAKAALDYARLLGLEGPVVYYQEYATPPLGSATIIQTCLEQRIFNCARAGDYEGALTTLHDVAQEYFYRDLPSIRVAECRFGALKSLLISVLGDIQQDIGEQFFIEDRSITSIIGAETLASFLALADALFERIISATAKKRTEQIPDWLPPVRQFINDNYTDANLNISTTAELFGQNPTVLSNSFRRHFGIGILEYIHTLRLSQAKLLLGQGLNLDSIALQVGYSSTRTMSRAFQKYEGVTPGRLNRFSRDPGFDI